MPQRRSPTQKNWSSKNWIHLRAHKKRRVSCDVKREKRKFRNLSRLLICIFLNVKFISYKNPNEKRPTNIVYRTISPFRPKNSQTIILRKHRCLLLAIIIITQSMPILCTLICDECAVSGDKRSIDSNRQCLSVPLKSGKSKNCIFICARLFSLPQQNTNFEADPFNRMEWEEQLKGQKSVEKTES